MKNLYQKPIFIFLLPLVFYLIKIEEFLGFFSLAKLSISIVYFIGSYIFIFLISNKFFNDKKAFYILFFLSAILFIYFGYFQEVVFANIFLKRFIFLVPFFMLIIILTYLVIKNKTKIQQELIFYFNVLCVGIILLQSILIISKSQKIQNNYFPELNLNQEQSATRPNIYFFLLDEYAGKTTLEKFYKYDNSNFYNELRKRKFYVAEKFSANYDKTPLCMASLFNMNYIKKETIYPFTTYNNYLKYFKAIKANPLFNFLQNQQIEIFNNSLFEINNTQKIFQFNNFPQVENLIHKDIFHIKLWKSFAYIFIGGEFNVPYFFEKWVMKNHRNNINIFKESIKSSKSKTDRQKFVYSHLMLPHAPYYCDSNGKVFSRKELGLKNKEAYIPYLVYTNKEILKLSDEIIKNDTNAILIFMSDHGDRYALKPFKNLSYESHAFDNFFAIKTLKSDSTYFKNVKSNVNVFRILLNIYFSQNLNMINDSVFNFDERKNTATVIEIK